MLEEEVGAIETAVRSFGYEVVRLGDIRGCLQFMSSERSVDFVFNMAEGIHGRSREAQIPCLLEAFWIPYTFSDPLTLSVCLDKSFAKRIWQSYGLPTPEFLVVSDLARFKEESLFRFEYPLFVKPVSEGTSKGINEESIVVSFNELVHRIEWILMHYDQPAIIEEYLPGREFTIGVLGNGATARTLGAVEISMIDPFSKVYGYQQKEECETRVTYSPVKDPSLLADLSRLAMDAYTIVGCHDAGRVDVRISKSGEPQLLELNPLPGLHPTHSDLPIIATQVGMSYRDLIGEIIDSFWDRISPKFCG
ncbi:D-alanine-D-alanine ligase [Anaerolineae bacterium]|nr:D-alanine-D-alanine ligase [Anaerolineae bacterium]